MAVPSNYAALITAIDAILTTYGLSLFQVFGGRSTQPSLRELISLRWKLFSMTTPANYATLIAEIDVVIESYGLSLQEVFGGRSTQPTLQELIDLRYELFEVDGGGAADPSQIVSSTLPTTRVNPSTGLPSGGDPLQVGDRWYKPSMGREGFWNGSLWLSIYQNNACLAGGVNSSSGGGAASTNLIAIPQSGIFWESIEIGLSLATPQDASNYWVIAFNPTGSAGTLSYSYDLRDYAAFISSTNQNTNIIWTTNIFLAGTSYGTINLLLTRVGSPAALTTNQRVLRYRDVLA